MTGFPGGDAAGVVHLEAKPRLGIRGGKKEEEGEEGLFFKANSMVACPVIVGLGRSATRIKISRRLDDRRMRDSQPASAQARARACACDSNAKFSSSKILIGTSLKRVFCSSLHIKSLYGKYMSPHPRPSSSCTCADTTTRLDVVPALKASHGVLFTGSGPCSGRGSRGTCNRETR